MNKILPKCIEIVFSDGMTISMGTYLLEERADMGSDELARLERARKDFFHFLKILYAL